MRNKQHDAPIGRAEKCKKGDCDDLLAPGVTSLACSVVGKAAAGPSPVGLVPCKKPQSKLEREP